jgi:hypothetical protein
MNGNVGSSSPTLPISRPSALVTGIWERDHLLGGIYQ